MTQKAMVFAPHPDDAEFFAGGLIASLVATGIEVLIVTATDGCCGSYRETREELINLRKKEAENAAKIMGTKVLMLGYHDYELDQQENGLLRERLCRLIRTHRPDIAISIDPFASNETHPDHRALSWAASDAISHSGLPLVYPQHMAQGLEPHYISEKYYYSDDFAIHNKIVDITAHFEAKLAGMKAHESQVVFLVEDFFRQAAIAGVDLKSNLGPAVNDPFMALAFALRSQAEEIGKRGGYALAESYRYNRFHPFIEDILLQQNK